MIEVPKSNDVKAGTNGTTGSASVRLTLIEYGFVHVSEKKSYVGSIYVYGAPLIGSMT